MDAITLKSKLPGHLAQYADQFLAGELCYGVPATLLAAVCDRESRGGTLLNPPGPGGTGDSGHGRGLMQIDDRSHGSYLLGKFSDGVPLWKSPSFNVLYAAWLLRTNYNKTNGSWAAAVAAYNAGLPRVLKVLPNGNLDGLTTGGNYVSDVLARQKKFESVL